MTDSRRQILSNRNMAILIGFHSNACEHALFFLHSNGYLFRFADAWLCRSTIISSCVNTASKFPPSALLANMPSPANTKPRVRRCRRLRFAWPREGAFCCQGSAFRQTSEPGLSRFTEFRNSVKSAGQFLYPWNRDSEDGSDPAEKIDQTVSANSRCAFPIGCGEHRCDPRVPPVLP
jgi:hypothetical protein